MFNIETEKLTKISAIAALYAVLTIIFSPISYGPIQVRISEALTILPFFLGSWAAFGLWIGVIIANYVGGFGLIDIVLGGLLTLIAGLLTAQAKNIWLSGLYPVIINAFGVALILKITADYPYWISVLQVGVGQTISVYLIGILVVGQVFQRTNLKDQLE